MLESNRPTLSALKEIKLLQVFRDAELESLLSAGQAMRFEAHSNIVIEGEMSWGIYLILKGTAGIYKTNKLTGDSYDVGQLHQGAFFGEMSLVDGNPRSATVRALTQCELFHVSKDAFRSFLGSSPELKLKFYEACIKNVVDRLRELDDSYVISQYQLWKTLLKKKEAA
jgi:CRP-like cAMP-binding protein